MKKIEEKPVQELIRAYDEKVKQELEKLARSIKEISEEYINERIRI